MIANTDQTMSFISRTRLYTILQTKLKIIRKTVANRLPKAAKFVVYLRTVQNIRHNKTFYSKTSKICRLQVVPRTLMKYTKQEWFTPAEVVVHNTSSDCWVSLNGKVRNLTSWLQDQFRLCRCTRACSCTTKNWYCGDSCVEYCSCFKRGYTYCDAKRLAMTVLAYAGKDVSHWFKGDDWVHYIHPIVTSRTEYHRHGPGHRRPVVPSTLWRPITNPWWLDESNVEGKLTERTRPIRITNTLTDGTEPFVRKSNSHLAGFYYIIHNLTAMPPDGSSVTLEVCSEETIYQIMMRYLPHNSHMMSYTWRYLGRGIDYNKTLAENGIPDERDRFSDVALLENLHIPDLLLYFNDDLTEEPPKEDCFCNDIDCVLERPEKCYKDAEFIQRY